MQIDQIWDFLQRLSPLTRSCLLAELERMELCGVDMPGSADIQAKLRAEFRKDGSSGNNEQQPSFHFFAALEPVLMEGAPDYDCPGRIPRASLAPIWEWITRDLLPTMARDFNWQMKGLIGTDKKKELKQAVSVFQTKVVKYLENTLSDPAAAGMTQARLATYTSSRSAYGDLVKMMTALRARDAIAQFDRALPEKFTRFDKNEVAKARSRLDAMRKDSPDALPFAVAMIGKRLKTPWHLIRLATASAASGNAADVAASPYAVAVAVVLDRIDDGRRALRIALKQNRVIIARDLLGEIYDTEHALTKNIARFDDSEWGTRLQGLMDAVEGLVAAEIDRFPPQLGHVLGSRRRHSGGSLAERLAMVASRGRDVVVNGAAYCRKMVQPA